MVTQITFDQSGQYNTYNNSWVPLHNAIAAFLHANPATLPTVDVNTPLDTIPQYVTYNFTDSLSSSYPVYIKIGYYLTKSTSNIWSADITVGTDSNFTNNHKHFLISVGNAAIGTYGLKCYVSGNNNRLHFAFGELPTGSQLPGKGLLSVERTKDVTGNDTSEGVIVQVCDGNGPFGVSVPGGGQASNAVLPYPTEDTYLAGDQRIFNCAQSGGSYTKSALPIVPFNVRPYNPGYGLMAYYASDFTPGSSTSIIMTDGASHTFMPLQQVQNDNWFVPNSSYLHLLMRYE